ITSQRSFLTADDSGTVITSLIAGTVGGVAQIKAVSGDVSQMLNIIMDDGSVLVGSIVLTANPASIPADGASSTAITAVVKDTLGNPVPIGTPVAFTTSLGTFPNTFTSIIVNTPDNSGTVTTSLIAGLVDGVAFVTATAGSLSQAMEVPILETITGGLNVTANPTSLVANGTSTSLIRATLTDSNGNPMAGENVTFSTTLGTIIGGPTVATNASGVADVTLQSTTTTGTAAVTATANGITATVNVTFTSGAPGSLLLAAAPSTVNPGGGACSTSCCESTSTLTATLRDTEGNPMPGQAITFIFTTNQSGGTLSGPSAVTNINGQATITYTAGNEEGTDRVTARSVTNTTITDYVDIVVDASASVVGSITVTSGVSSLVANGTSQTAIRATVLNSCGNPMSGVTVNFATTLGTLSAANALTNASGVAQVTLTSAANTGTATVTAEASGFVASVNVAFVAGTPTSLLLTATPSTVNPAGTSTVTATLRDINNNPLVGQTISFLLTINASGATLSAPSAVTNINGQATITYTAGATQPTLDRVTARSIINTAITDFVDITVEGGSSLEVAAIALVASQDSILPGDTIAITAMVYDSSGHGLAGQTLAFTLDDPTLGFITASGTTASDGTFVATFEARTEIGTVNITATSGSVSSEPN
ncbi:MAG: invasin domain 3-containing protein, partial [Desulfosalsimonadaceae bacterium]|nr:invasin domain 3-containing protein [Desulfosalsimonadaceae bacterium]